MELTCSDNAAWWWQMFVVFVIFHPLLDDLSKLTDRAQPPERILAEQHDNI